MQIEYTQWMSTEEAAKVLRVTVWTLRGYLRTGKVRGKKIGMRWLVNPADVLPPKVSD